MKSLKKFIGVDASHETSLFEYGFICKPYFKDGREDEYFCIYRQNDKYGTGYITEEFLNDLVKGNEWMSEKDIVSFLSYVGSDIVQWLELSFVNKLSNLLSFYSSENIFGTDYYPSSEDEIRNLYKF
jgi:hypothetical protein